MCTKTEFHCSAFNVRYWSRVAQLEKEPISEELQRVTMEPEGQCPWCLEKHTRTVVSPRASEAAESR